MSDRVTDGSTTLSMTVGPVIERVNVSRRGAISPSSRWRVLLDGDLKTLTLDCGHFGLGPMHASVDGTVIGTFDKPSRRNPWVLSSPMAFGSSTVRIYADSRDFGDSVNCEVFVDGVSALDKKPIGSVEELGIEAATANARYISPFDAVRVSRTAIWQTAWMAPAYIGARLAVDPTSRTLLIGMLFVAYVVVCWTVAKVASQREAGVKPGAYLRRLRAVAGPLVCLVVDIALGVMLLGAVGH